MPSPRADLILSGRVVVAVAAGGLETAEAVAVRDGRVVATGDHDALLEAAPGARAMDFGDAAIVPGIHDFHLHLVGMARARRDVRLDGVRSPDVALSLVRHAAGSLPAGDWLRGRGWSEELLTAMDADALEACVAGRPAIIYSHDAHSAWASRAALRAAGVTAGTVEPAGGRIERSSDGTPSGVLREAATDIVEQVAGRLRGDGLDAALDETMAELAALGITGATDAGDTTDENGVGEHAFLGDRASLLLAARGRLDGRLRLTVNLPAASIPAAREAGIRTGAPIPGARTLDWGWAKVYADGALGSRTAALFAPYTCGRGRQLGIARLTPGQLAATVGEGRGGGISAAVHAIGDRAVAMALDAIEQAGPRLPGAPPDRIEHAQLVRAADRPRFAALDVTASVQPVHCAADRAAAEECWADRLADAYAYRSLAAAGARLAFGTDAPIEVVNPWHNLFAAIHRRIAGDGTPDWRPGEALGLPEALAAMTSGPALAGGRHDVGLLRPGAHADLAVLNASLGQVLEGEETLAVVRSILTLVDGAEVHRA